MRIMIIIVSVLVIVLTSCKKNGNTTTGQNPSLLKIDSSSLTLNGSISDVDSFSIKYNGKWAISSNPTTVSWFQLNSTTGTGNGKIHITTKENNKTGSPRVATIIITPDGNSAFSVNIQVAQLAEKQWSQLAVFPGVGRRFATNFVVGNKFYVGLGSGIKNNNEQNLQDLYEYDPVLGTWNQKTDFPGGPREFSIGFSINGKGYVGLGGNVSCSVNGCTGTNFKDLWEYNQGGDSWTKIASFDFLETNETAGTKVFVIGNNAYFFSGKKLWEFDPINLTLTQKASSPEEMIRASAFSIDDKGYVGTGDYAGATLLKSFYEYDPAVDRWSKKSDFNGPARRAATGFAINGKGYIACGEGIKEVSPGTFQYIGLNDVWEYTPITNSWTRVADYPRDKPFYFVGDVINGRAILGTGHSYDRPTADYLKDFWIY